MRSRSKDASPVPEADGSIRRDVERLERQKIEKALGQFGDNDDIRSCLEVLVKAADWGKNSLYTSMLALNALDAMDGRAAAAREAIAALPRTGEGSRRLSAYVGNLLDKTLADLN